MRASTSVERPMLSRKRTVSIGYALALLVFGLPSELQFGAVSGVALFAAWMGGLLYVALKRELALISIMIGMFGVAYAGSIGNGLAFGVQRLGLSATPESSWTAVIVLALFLGVVVAVVSLTCRNGQRFRPPTAGGLRGWDLAVQVGFWCVALLTTVAAFRASAWTNYGAGQVERQAGGIRLELLYPAMLFGAVQVLASRSITTRKLPATTTVKMMMGLASVIVAVLIFAMQSRRLMLAAAGLVGVLWLFYVPIARNRGVKQARRLKILALTAVVGFALVASAAWRDATRDRSSSFSLLEGMTAAVNRIDKFDSQEVNERLTYFWLDATTIQLGEHLQGRMALGDAFVSHLVFVTPSVFLPEKRDFPLLTCESVYDAVIPDADLPCTVVAEAYLVGGNSTLLFLAIVWGLVIGLLERLWRRGGGLGQIFAVVAFAEFTNIETGMFPFLHGLRDGGISATLIAIVALFVMLALRQRSRGKHAVHPRGTRDYPRRYPSG